MTAQTSKKKSPPEKSARSVKQTGSKQSAKSRTKNADGNPNGHSSERLEKNWLEWLVFGISIVLVSGIIGYLVYLEAMPSSKDFDYEVAFKEPQRIDGRYLVPVHIKNKSNQSVQDVALEISSGSETADLQLDYLPRHSHRDATVFFKEKPSHVEGHISSFNIP